MRFSSLGRWELQALSDFGG